METILLVHGTGVRAAGFAAMMALVTQKAREHLPGYRIVGCDWGAAFGAELRAGGRSIPDYSGSGAAAGGRSTRLARWALLADDPLLEVRITPPTAVLVPEGSRLWDRFKALGQADAPSGDSWLPAERPASLMRGWGLAEAWSLLLDELTADAGWQRTVTAIKGSATQYAGPVARAVTAALSTRLQQAGLPGLTGDQRERLEEAVAGSLGSAGLGLGSWLRERLTDYAVPRRGHLSDFSGPAIGDILRYQARGEMLRNFIGECARREGASVVLAHSLGGVASVDWLAMGDRGIRALVTVGSQAPYFYEIDALTSLAYGQHPPEFFPKRWLNFFDPKDLLGYRAQEIFAGRAIDVRVDNGQPFPDSHSAYWQNDVEVWPEIARVLG